MVFIFVERKLGLLLWIAKYNRTTCLGTGNRWSSGHELGSFEISQMQRILLNVLCVVVTFS